MSTDVKAVNLQNRFLDKLCQGPGPATVRLLQGPEITGKITNRGDRPLRLVEINCVFYDPYGQLILRERVAIVKRTGASLKTGETRAFRLPFDSIPSTWNQTLPQLVIARIDFEH